MRIDTVLIDRPERQPPIRRTLFGVLTIVAWGVYASLWLPLVTSAVWLLGVRSAYVELYLDRQPVDPFLFLVLPSIALAATVLLIGWAEYNRLRFGRLDRRRPQPNVGLAAVAVALGASPEMAQALQQTRSAVLRMSEEAQPLGIVMGKAPGG